MVQDLVVAASNAALKKADFDALTQAQKIEALRKALLAVLREMKRERK
jgi:hypothetical protein